MSKTKEPSKYWFDQAKVDHVITWVETYCTHPVGDLAGQPLLLPEWFKRDVIAPAFGWKKLDGSSKYTQIYEEIAKGNAKSTLGTALALYCLCADKQRSPRVYCVAGSKEQAGIIFNAAKIMVQQNEDLCASIQIFRNALHIQSEYGLGILMAVSADSDLQQGLNGTAVFFDELHVQPNSDLYDTLLKGFVKRKDPRMFMFTTAGINFTFAKEIHDKAVDIRDGKIKDDSFLPVVYAADPDGDDFDIEQLKKANPGWDYLNIERLMSAMEDAKKSATDLASFRRYHLNKWTGANVVWMSDERWMNGTASEDTTPEGLRRFRAKYLSIEALSGRSCYLGLDFSSNKDTTAAAYIFPPATPGERVKVYIRVYIPNASMLERIQMETGSYAEWRKDGDIVITYLETQDLDFIYGDISEHAKRFKILCVSYDRYNADTVVNKLISEGIECKPYKQDFYDMNTPMKKLEALVLAGQFEHGGHPVLRWQAGNLEAKVRTIGGVDLMMPTKSSNRARIDGMVAIIIGIGIWIWKTQEAEKAEKSLQKTKGITSIKLNR